MRRTFNPEPTEIVDDDRWLELERPEAPARGYVRGDESEAGDFQPIHLGQAIFGVIEFAAKCREIGGNCESPIEEYLGAEILLAFERARLELRLCKMVDLEHQDDRLLLVPQFKWSIYRSDWAILKNRKDAPALLIECDGKDFHSSSEQRAHDARKDAAALERGHMTLRFTGSEIYRSPSLCAAAVLDIVCGGKL